MIQKTNSKSTLNQGREDPSCTRGHGSVDTGDCQHHAQHFDADFDLVELIILMLILIFFQHHADYFDADFDLFFVCQHQTSYDWHADADAGQRYLTCHVEYADYPDHHHHDHPRHSYPCDQDVVDTHPGLLFLKEATEFHSRYVHTVSCCCSNFVVVFYFILLLLLLLSTM